ncbi:putative serine/threonine-protein kinase PBL5 [Bidens hawaiensis]|uniref:putative serine/threonine-protein kinase PBL5 n=1 Tax=Bidens hawaiensis TaxID=980011 RepID=UPI00404AD673
MSLYVDGNPKKVNKSGKNYQKVDEDDARNLKNTPMPLDADNNSKMVKKIGGKSHKEDEKYMKSSKSSKNKPIDESDTETVVTSLDDYGFLGRFWAKTESKLKIRFLDFKKRKVPGFFGLGGIWAETIQIVAIKQLDPNGEQGVREFVVEVMTLNMVDHPDLVKLNGYCAEKEHRLLVYEYMAQGSLSGHKKGLDWSTRVNIAVVAARGLEYLQDKMKPVVIYRDLKASNILLREDYHEKLSDFGLERVGPLGGKTHVTTRVMGTYGYCAPEYAMTGKLNFLSSMSKPLIAFLQIFMLSR